MPNYTAREGDTIGSIAYKYGVFWETIWNHTNNDELKRKRKNPNVLYPGDVVFIPEKEQKEELCMIEERHRFLKKGVPAMFRVKLLIDDEVRANEQYILEIDGELFSGTTLENGSLEHSIPPNTRSIRILVGEKQDEYLLKVGHLDPFDEVSGMQARLNNLGFDCGEIDGILGPRTEAALKKFQIKYELPDTGKLDEASQNKLFEIYGS